MINFLAIRWDVNPEMFALGPIHLRYYGVLFVLSFIAAYFVMRKIFRREQMSQNLLDNFAFTIVISAVIGARLGHCLFYQPTHFLTHPWEIVWPFSNGEFIGFQGLASHGGAIGILLGLWWWCRKQKKSYMWAMERIVVTTPLAGAIIRFGNLMNSEIYGDVTSLPWGFEFIKNLSDWMAGHPPIYTAPSHPTQIYEALAYLAIFFVMWFLYSKKLPKLKRGMLFGIFLILLFGMRFLIEFIKQTQVPFEDSLSLNMGQILSLPFILAGIGILCWAFVKGKPELELMKKEQAKKGNPVKQKIIKK